MSGNNKPIGVFDSGVGGLTVLHAMRELMPHESIIYLGDTARVPYGTKSPESVQRYAMHAADWFVERGIKLLVVACNTASALALPDLQQRLAPIPVIGVVGPGAAVAVQNSRSQRHLVLATEATALRRAYTRAIHALNPEAHVVELPCSLFVALAEEGWPHGKVATAVAEEYLGYVRDLAADEKPDTAILGCTHFPLLIDSISAVLGPDITIVDSATTTAKEVQRTLREQQLAADPAAKGSLKLVATDGAARFARIGTAFLAENFVADDIEITDIHPTDTGR